LLATSNYAAVVRPLQIIVLAVAGLFLVRVMRVAIVEVRPPKVPKSDQEIAAEAAVAAATAAAAANAPQAPARSRRRRRSPLALEFIEPTHHAGEVLDIADTFVIGRAADCDVVVDDVYLSSRHARFSYDDGDSFVEDLDSTNGTYVNQRLISHRTRLERGDIVQVGGVIFEVVR
jgi:hypothetical protein